MFKSLSDCYTLTNGVKIPCVGYGTYLTPDGEVCENGVKSAIETGYRHIDTASFYKNEKGVGEGVRQSGIDRKDIFVTSKLWNDEQGYENTLRSFDETLKNLGFDYLDMYLIHWPNPLAFRDSFPKKFIDTWRAFETLYKEGRVRAIGVCNSLSSHLKCLFEECDVKPMVNQIEFHIGYTQQEAVKFCKENGLLVEAWAPLCKARVFSDPKITALAEKHGKMPSQILLRWCLEKEVLPLPKSVNPSRIVENSKIFDFNLDAEDIEFLDNLDICARLGSYPDTANF